MAREKKPENEPEVEPIIDEARAKRIFNEMKQDPDLRKFLVPIPDYGLVGCIIAYKSYKLLVEKLGK